MPPNLRKSQPNLSKPSDGGGFQATKKSEATNPLQGLNISAERELGSSNGIKATGKLTVGVDNLIGQQGIQIEADATNRTLGIGAEIGSTRGKLGVNIGGKIGYGPDGKISIKGAEAGINIAGTGGSVSIDEDEGIKGSISVAGAKVEVAVAPDGKKSLSLCYGVPGGELCVKFEPDPEIAIDENVPPPVMELTPEWELWLSPEPVVVAPNYGGDIPLPEPPYPWGNPPELLSVPVAQKDKICRIVVSIASSSGGWRWLQVNDAICRVESDGSTYRGYGRLVEYTSTGELVGTTEYRESEYFTQWHNPDPIRCYPDGVPAPIIRERNFTTGQQKIPARPAFWGKNCLPYPYDTKITPFIVRHLNTNVQEWWGLEEAMFAAISKKSKKPSSIGPTTTGASWVWYSHFSSKGNCTKYMLEAHYCGPETTKKISIPIPNYPQHFTPMDCCTEIKEIYKYLGIAKLKKNKMKLAKALMVPKGQGDEKLEDYYEIMENLFRVLANGGIFNPISKPLGVDYQNTNATSWASEIYEMVAEAKSNGDSTQRFEMLASFQLVQMMKVLAEQRRMIECLSEAIGITPDLATEEVPVMFTIHEAHKGFDKKTPKEIDISKAKTDDQVEAILGKVFKPSKIPITKWVFNPNHISISEAINKL